MRLEISREVLEGIRGEAAASPAVEVCGLLFGAGLRVDKARSCRNVADSPATAFEIDPAQLIAGHRAARDAGRLVIGHYHSHPNGIAEPSARDAAAAYGGEVWLIVAGDDTTAWLASSEGGFERLQFHPSLQHEEGCGSRAATPRSTGQN